MAKCNRCSKPEHHPIHDPADAHLGHGFVTHPSNLEKNACGLCDKPEHHPIHDPADAHLGHGFRPVAPPEEHGVTSDEIAKAREWLILREQVGDWAIGELLDVYGQQVAELLAAYRNHIY